MFQDFEEWFAVRNRHSDDDLWPARLTFDKSKGIILDTIHLSNDGSIYDAPNCDTGTITGYLDYQRPTTLLEPWVQSRGGGSIGINTVLVPSRARLFASAVLKNIHLEDLNEKCFTSIHVNMPAFSTWNAPNLVRSEYKQSESGKFPNVSVEIGEAIHEEFSLNDGTRVRITSFAGASDDDSSTKITQKTYLTLYFSKSEDYFKVQRRIARLNTIFSFLLGQHMAQNPYELTTTHCRSWNGEDAHVVAELLFRPAFKSDVHHLKWFDAIFQRENCGLNPKEILDAVSEKSDSLFYLMNMVLKMEKPERLSASDFSELIGCIEDFDVSINGNGSSREQKEMRRRILEIVKDNGSDDDFNSLSAFFHSQPNRLPLADRLERLQRKWTESGFFGSMNISEIKRIRNDVAHGRGANLSDEDYRKIVRLNYDVCAIARFHIFVALGIGIDNIAEAYRRLGFRFGRYAPKVQRVEK